MRNDWIFDAVQAEVAYRTEQIHRAARAGRPSRRRRWRRVSEVRVPEQRSPAPGEVLLTRAGTR
ncbi:hypothetical protein FNH05_16285 [Amycolatopsis rhizosphaerae]|uniref:Uncharacterized protein n=1 Tax=Amycolatopsis rhizosphaerae TaxID=2053003 RepID=A0A558CMU0_9PSEU|nr:hypothetical protein [Amycolatopsis rhizosphaerae]TVT50091.1 hypothetical protein FNH05_16285 [Amycolatopsis rhizosphaerae]